MPVYSKANRETHAFVNEVMAQYHGALIDAEVTVAVLFAGPTDAEHESGEGPPYLKHDGYPAAATVAITPVKWRTLGVADAVITIDRESWKPRGEAERTALVDHELHHLELAHDPEGNLRSDDAGRPKLKMRLHDVQIGGFTRIIERHGEHAVEAQQLAAVFGLYRQQLLKWGDDSAPQDAAPDMAGVVA